MPADPVHAPSQVTPGKAGATPPPPREPSGPSVAEQRVGAPESRRDTGAHRSTRPAAPEGLNLSDELEEEQAEAEAQDAEKAREEEAKKRAEEARVEEERAALEEALHKVEVEIADTRKSLDEARQQGDDEAVRRLGGHLDALQQERDDIQRQLQDLPAATPAPPEAAGAGTAPGPVGAPTAPGAAGGGGGPAPTGAAPGAGGGAAPVMAPGGAPGQAPATGGGGGIPAGGSPAVAPVNPADGVPTVASNQPVAGGPIGKGTKVLMIGDSHTIGPFGTELDKDLRATGASVSTYGSSGSSPSWWLNGTTTHSGFVARHADGSVEQPPWNSPHATPRLAELIAREKPDVLVVNLGANMRGASPQQIRQEVARLAEVARASGTRLVWVGPPRTQQDMANPSSMNAFNEAMRDAVAPYGSYIDSSRYTSYSGSDGIHYGGTQGTRNAQSWADHVFADLQG